MKCSRMNHPIFAHIYHSEVGASSVVPALPGARRFTFLAQVRPVPSVDVNKREWELL